MNIHSRINCITDQQQYFSYPVSSIMAKVILENTLFWVWDPVIASFC